MAIQKFLDSAGREAYKNEMGQVFTEGGKKSTGYTVDSWNKRQLDRWGGQTQNNQNNQQGIQLGSTQGGNFQNVLQSAIQANQQAIQPAVQSLQASVSPLQDRYKALLESIKGNQQTATNRQTVATSNEMGRRGILPSSGLYDQQLTDALQPVTSEYAGLTASTGLQQEKDLQAIQNTITQLQSGASSDAIPQAISLLQTQLQNQQTQLQNKQAERLYNEVTLPASRASIKTGNSDATQMAEFAKLYLMGQQAPQPQQAPTTNLNPDDIYNSIMGVVYGPQQQSRSVVDNPSLVNLQMPSKTSSIFNLQSWQKPATPKTSYQPFTGTLQDLLNKTKPK